MTIDKLVPGLVLLRDYKRDWLSADLVAGLSVAAVALPIGIAYAQLAGFPPVVGIYSCILPPIAYALFGSYSNARLKCSSAFVRLSPVRSFQ